MHRFHEASTEWELILIDSDEQTACGAENAIAAHMPCASVRRLEELAAVEPALMLREGSPTLVLCKIDAQNVVDFFPVMHSIRNKISNAFVVVYTQLLEPSMTVLFHDLGVSTVVPLISEGQTQLLLGAAALQADRRYRVSIEPETTGTGDKDVAAMADRTFNAPTDSSSHAEVAEGASPVTLALAEEAHQPAAQRTRLPKKFSRSMGTMKDLLAKFSKRLGLSKHVEVSADAVHQCADAREDSASRLGITNAVPKGVAAIVNSAREDSALGLSSSHHGKAVPQNEIADRLRHTVSF